LWMWPVGLDGAGSPIHEEMEIVCHHVGGRFETKLPYCLLPEVRWTALLLHVSVEMMRASGHMGRQVVLTN